MLYLYIAYIVSTNNTTNIAELEDEDMHNKEIFKDAKIINKTYVRQNAIINPVDDITNFEPTEILTVPILKRQKEVILAFISFFSS